jgi:PAS domain S-box-containing protein
MTSTLQHSDWLNGRVPDSVRAHLRQLVEVVGYLPHLQPLGVITADAVLLAANRPFLDLLGASDDELLGSDWDDFMPGWSARTALEDAGEGVPFTQTFEDYLLPGVGKPVWVRVVACPVFTPEQDACADEALAAWVVFVLDQRPGADPVDRQRRTAILDLLLESPSEFVVQLGADAELRYVSPSLKRVLGVFADGVEGRPLSHVHALAAPGFAARFPDVMRALQGPPYRADLEMAMPTAQGDHWVQWRFESLLSDGGAVEGVLGVGHDVTERRRAESELAESELRLRTLVESTSQLTWTTGPGGVVDGPMESWSAFTGQTEEEVRGDGWADAVHPDDRSRVLRTWGDAVAGGGLFDCVCRLRAADRTYRWIETHAVPLPGAGAPRYFGVGQDITTRKQAEKAAERHIELESMAAAVSQYLAQARIEDVPAAVDYALGETGRHLGADRVSLYLVGPDGIRLAGVRVWRRVTGACEDGDATHGLGRLGWIREQALHGEAVVLRTPDDLPAEAVADRAIFTSMGLGAALAVPMRQEPTLIGLLLYEMDAEENAPDGAQRRWSDDDVSLVRLVADQLASLYVWRHDELNLKAVAEGFLAFGPDAGRNLTHICRAAAAVTAADVVLYSRRRGSRLVAETGWNLPDGLPASTGAAGWLDADVLERSGEEVFIEQGLQQSACARTSPIIELTGASMHAGFPVRVGGKPVAALSCLFGRDVVLRKSQLELLRVLGRAAAVEEERRRAIEDRVLGLAQLEQAMERTVVTLSGAVSARDPYTVGHERRVGELAVAIGKTLGMDADDLRLLRLAATVHDLGKITVPAEILSKPTRLGEVEFAIIRSHSQAGWEMLEPAGLPASVTDAVLQHHERLDGSGYPAGLRGGDIGEFARIIAVADVVEAMSSHRPYRPAMGSEPALAEIEQGAGTRYDAAASSACLQLFRDEGFVFSD